MIKLKRFAVLVNCKMKTIDDYTYEDLRARVFAICDSSEVDFCCTEGSLEDLIADLQICETQCDDDKIKDVQRLTNILKLHEAFFRMDTALGKRRYTECGDLFCEAGTILGNIVGTDIGPEHRPLLIENTCSPG